MKVFATTILLVYILNTAKKLYIHCIADSISHCYTFYLGTFFNSNKMAQKKKKSM